MTVSRPSQLARALHALASLLVCLSLAGCQMPPAQDPPIDTECSSEANEWGDSDGVYHLGHDALSPVVVNESSYTPDLASWNALGSPITLRDSGEGFEIRVIDGGDSSSGWLGLASIAIGSGHHTTSGTVTMNRTLLASYPVSVAKLVICQELGHLLGLDHQRGSVDSCMDDCQGRGGGDAWLECLSSVARQTPNAHDGEQLQEIYKHALPEAKPPPTLCVGASVVLHVFRTH